MSTHAEDEDMSDIENVSSDEGAVGGPQVDGNVAADSGDEELRKQCEEVLDEDLVKFTDLLVRRFENKLDRNSQHIAQLCQKSDKRSRIAFEMAKKTRTELVDVRTTAENALAATEEQGKQLTQLQDQIRSIQSGRNRLVKTANLKLTALSSEERVEKIQSRYAKLISDSNSTTTFRLGRKKGESDASMDFSSLFSREYVTSSPSRRTPSFSRSASSTKVPQLNSPLL
jgi:hypothetical protein